MMNAIAYAVIGYLVAQAVVLLALAIVSEWLHPTRSKPQQSSNGNHISPEQQIRKERQLWNSRRK